MFRKLGLTISIIEPELRAIQKKLKSLLVIAVMFNIQSSSKGMGYRPPIQHNQDGQQEHTFSLT
ncbi:hypothetical protein VS_II1355 [Vibrio atlanticus]|uniref:Uncharacterized protein n=1 Tax=Vibrio atlanticus (strain LGP32) TaxID=575788 RepID=B7VTA1_VIBA3|nr:hypothetical protein VS_II1355 [Vibrio atlanticus]